MCDKKQFGVILAVFLICCINSVKSQEVMLEKDTRQSAISKKTGVNRKHYGYLFGNYTVYTYKSTSNLNIETFKSRNFSVGYRRVCRVTDIYSLVGGALFLNDSYTINQLVGKTFPTTTLHKYERVLTNNFSADFYNRVIIKKEYNQMGLFVDFGAFGSLAVCSKHKMYDESTNINFFGNTQMLAVRGLKYIEPFTYGVVLRVGYNHFAFVLRQRLSNWLKPSFGFAQPPKTSIGLELSVY